MAKKDVTEESTATVPITTSVPLKLPAEQEGLFREVLSVLDDARVPFTVAGGFALQQHTGICRFTKDLDLFLTAPNAARALDLLADSGFYCEVLDPVWLAKAHRDGYFIDLITGMSNGAIAVDDAWIARSHPGIIVNTRTKVLAPEELIASKLFVTRRERFDGVDIAHIIYALRGKLEWSRLLEIAGEHWELVLWNLVLFRYVYPAHADYIPKELWEDLLSRYRGETRAPVSASKGMGANLGHDGKSPNAKFRGSLIDDKMFAIDLNDWGMENTMEQYQAAREKIPPFSHARRAAKSRRRA